MSDTTSGDSASEVVEAESFHVTGESALPIFDD